MNGKRVSYWIPIIIIIILISLVVVYIQSNSQLNEYKGAGVSEIISDTDSGTDIDLITHENKELNYSIGIPEEWVKVTKSGYETYIHSASGTSVQIQVSDYKPQILCVTAETIQQELYINNCEMIDFAWNDTTSYTVIYKKINEAGENIGYVEMTYFDRNTIVRVIYTYNQEFTERITPLLTAIIDSFKWERAEPFSSELYITYSEFGNFEFGFPMNWESSANGNTFYSQDTNGTAISISVTQSEVTYENVSQFDYINFASASRNNFILSEYISDNNIISAEASYINNGTPMILKQYLIASGEYEYTITIECTQNLYNSYIQLFDDVVKTFRRF